MDYLRSVPGTDPTLLKDVVVGEGSRQAERIQGQTTLLLDIAAVAPMVGLLGTVFGMLKAFGSIAHDLASAKPVVLASGLTQAMVTTAFGLMVGIPAMMFYAYFRRRASRQISVLEAASTEVMAAMLTKQI
jgi:biopolymer transport protein ExbB